jgi:predicted dinucleotide-binding enzyme
MNDTSNSLTRRTALSLLGALAAQSWLGPVNAAAAQAQKIGFIGAGRMGTALSTLLVKAGHEVMLSSRHPEELKPVVEGIGNKARAGTVAEAMQFGDVIFLTLPYSGLPDLARDYGKVLAAKPLVVDVGNAVPNRDGAAGAAGSDKGAGVYFKELLPGVKVVRAFNAMNWAKLPEYATRTGANKVAAPILGEDKGAIALAEKLIREMGFEPVLVGGLDRSKDTAPRSPLADDHTPEEVRKIAAGMK